MTVRRRLVREAVRTLHVGPSTVRYPKERVAPPEGFRGRIEVDGAHCIGCSKCAIVCPTLCITMVADVREVPLSGGKTITRKRKPEVRLFDCIRCGLCEDVCPTEPKSIRLSEAFAGSATGKGEVVR